MSGDDRVVRFAAILIGLIGIVATGCGRAPVAAPQAPAVSKSTPPAAPLPKNDIATTPVAASQASKPSENATVEQPETEELAYERIAIFTLDGPLVLDVAVTLDGRPLTAVFDQQVKQVLVSADTDKDGRATWKELATNEQYAADGQPNRPPIGARQLKALIERYDENRDGQVQAREALAWLGRNTQTTAHAFEVRSTRSYLPNPRADSRVWQLVDADGSGGISQEELAAAPAKFWVFDADDDRVIIMPELASLRELLEAQNPQMSFTTPEDNFHAAIHLKSEKELDGLESVLASLYSPRQTIGVTSLGRETELFDLLDGNFDGWLEKQELAKFLTVEPHLKLAIAFKTPSQPDALSATMKVCEQSDEVRALAQSQDHAVFALGNTRLIVSARDLMPGAAPPAPSVDRSQIRLMVHDEYDALFGELDANADGRLGEREIDSCPVRLMAKDANGDAQVGADEVTYSMIVAFLRGERASEQSFYIPATSAVALTDKPASTWFVRADFNRDGDISRREFLGSLDQFSQLDTDGDGYIGAQEAAAFE